MYTHIDSGKCLYNKKSSPDSEDSKNVYKITLINIQLYFYSDTPFLKSVPTG